MKMNQNELTRMINQIDDDLLNEAAEEYHTSNFGNWKRVIPVAACITLLILGAAVSVLRNITIERGHEGIEGTVISENKGDKEETLNNSEKSYIIQMDSSEEKTLSSILGLITDSFSEKGVAKNLVIDSMEIRLLPKDTVISNGRIVLKDPDNSKNITISISQNKIVVSSEEQENKNKAEISEQAAEASNEISQISWNDFYGASSYIQNISKEFGDSDYMLIGAELVAKISDIDNIPENIDILMYDGSITKVENREEIKNISYSYTFFISVHVQPDNVSNDILVVVK